MITEAAKVGDGIMHQYGLAALGLVICVAMMYMFVWMGLKVLVPVANALAAWSGNNAQAAASHAQAAASNARGAEANERISQKLEGLMTEMKSMYVMIQKARNEELIDMGKRGQRAVKGD